MRFSQENPFILYICKNLQKKKIVLISHQHDLVCSHLYYLYIYFLYFNFKRFEGIVEKYFGSKEKISDKMRVAIKTLKKYMEYI